MRAQTIVLAAVLAAGSSQAMARTIEVGSGKQYSTLGAAAYAARDGDTVHVFPGTYTSGAVWYANDLTITIAPGYTPRTARVSRGIVYGKGLFVVKGQNTTIDGLHFEYAAASSGDGAGIRLDGGNLTVKNSSFYGNEMGILATPWEGQQGALTVVNSRFDRTYSRRSGSLGHAIYANDVTELNVVDSQFTRTTSGHYIKSRAPENTITGNNIDDTYGSGSYLIEIAEGGGATITDNRLVKGANASNCCIAIQYGSEMRKGGSYVNPPGEVLIADNEFINRRNSTVYLVSNRSVPVNPVELEDNELTALSGRIRPLYGPGSVNDDDDDDDDGADDRYDQLALFDADFLFSPEWDDSFSMVDLLDENGRFNGSSYVEPLGADGLAMSSPDMQMTAFDQAWDDGNGAFALAPLQAEVPAPAGFALLGLGAAALIGARRRRG